MTSSTSSSSRGLAAAALVAALVAGCARTPVPPPKPAGDSRARLALLPPVNLTGDRVDLKSMRQSLEKAYLQAGIPVVAGAAVDEYLSRHRIRDTSGVDADAARLAGEELGVEGVVITAIQVYDEVRPQVSIASRIVRAGNDPAIVWMDAVSLSGDDAQGLFHQGLVRSREELLQRATTQLGASMAAYLAGSGTRAEACPQDGRFKPRISYRAPQYDGKKKLTVAVMPFLNRTRRRDAGEIAGLEVARQLAAVPRFTVIEPGVLRKQLRDYRIVMTDGVSLDDLLAVRAGLSADVVVSGIVFDWADGAGGAVPAVRFAIVAIDPRTGKVLWTSTSAGTGDQGVAFYDIGRIRSAPGLACLLARNVADIAAGTSRAAND